MPKSMGSIIINADSEPKGAKFYICYPDEKPKKRPINQDIKVFYYKKTKSITLILRKENYVNKSDTLFPPFPDSFSWSSKLDPVPLH